MWGAGKRAAREYGLILAALVIGLTGTAALAVVLWRDAQQADQRRFDTLTHFIQERLDDRVEKYEQYMILVREFLIENPLPSQSQWRQLLDRLKLPVNCRGLVSLGYAPRIKDEQLHPPSPALIAAIGTNAPPWESQENASPDGEFWPLLYWYAKAPSVTPGQFRSNLHASTELWKLTCISAYRNALKVTPRLSSIETNAPFNVAGAGFCMILTVHDTAFPAEPPPPTGESARKAHARDLLSKVDSWRGTLIGTIQMDELLGELVEKSILEVGFEVFDNVKVEARHRLNDRTALPSAADRRRRPELAHRVSTWRMYGDSWAIEFSPTAEFERLSPRRIVWVALGAGLAGTLAFTWLLWLQLQRRLAAESHARQMNEARDVIDTLSRERSQVSRDLHDGVLQSLYVLGLELQRTRRVIRSNPALAEQRSRQSLDTLELAMAELRRHLGGKSDGTNREMDLGQALGNLAEVMNRQGIIPTHLEVDSRLDLSPAPGITVQLLQITREAIANAQRHSGASQVRVSLSAARDGLELRISDNGRGIDADSPNGHGLKNMAARAEELGARYQLLSRPGEGVIVTVSLPASSCNRKDSH